MEMKRGGREGHSVKFLGLRWQSVSSDIKLVSLGVDSFWCDCTFIPVGAHSSKFVLFCSF